MGDRAAFLKLSKTAEKWRDLAEARRDYFRELYRSGRWRQYYKEEQFVTRLRDVARACDRWQMIVQQAQDALAASAASAATPEQRDAA